MWQKDTGTAGRVGFCQRGASETGEKGLGDLMLVVFLQKEKGTLSDLCFQSR